MRDKNENTQGVSVKFSFYAINDIHLTACYANPFHCLNNITHQANTASTICISLIAKMNTYDKLNEYAFGGHIALCNSLKATNTVAFIHCYMLVQRFSDQLKRQTCFIDVLKCFFV